MRVPIQYEMVRETLQQRFPHTVPYDISDDGRELLSKDYQVRLDEIYEWMEEQTGSRSAINLDREKDCFMYDATRTYALWLDLAYFAREADAVAFKVRFG